MQWNDEMLNIINARVTQDARKLPLATSIELLWHRKLVAPCGHGTLIVTTPRQLTTDGGDGWTGFDSADADQLHTAICEAVDNVGATGIIDRYITRSSTKLDEVAGYLNQLFK